MSQTIISQKIQKVCDGCGLTKEWELVGAGDDVVNEMQEWYEASRPVVIHGQFTKLTVQVCSIDCLSVAALKKLALPQVEEPDPDIIDLASLRTSGFTN